MLQKIFISIVLCLLPTPICLAGEIEFTYQNTFDHTTQKAAAFVPDVCKSGNNYPLLVVAHYMGGSRHTAREMGFYSECEARGWLLVCPELHGRRTDGSTSLVALEAQHDILDSIAFIKQKFQIDPSRIYLDGRSMGGALAAVMAAKYPDLFAAVVAGQGIYDLELWSRTTLPFLRPQFPIRSPHPLAQHQRYVGPAPTIGFIIFGY
jgi:poly(3-hydroxybutyrate) depolymerase